MGFLPDGGYKFNVVARNIDTIEKCAAQLEGMRLRFLRLGGQNAEMIGAYQGRFIHLRRGGIFLAQKWNGNQYLLLVRSGDGRLVNPGAAQVIVRFTPRKHRNLIFSIKQSGVPVTFKTYERMGHSSCVCMPHEYTVPNPCCAQHTHAHKHRFRKKAVFVRRLNGGLMRPRMRVAQHRLGVFPNAESALTHQGRFTQTHRQHAALCR
jgi:hypothetical protein